MLIKVKVRDECESPLYCMVTPYVACCITSNVFVLQTLTGKEIEIDIEPTDKVTTS